MEVGSLLCWVPVLPIDSSAEESRLRVKKNEQTRRNTSIRDETCFVVRNEYFDFIVFVDSYLNLIYQRRISSVFQKLDYPRSKLHENGANRRAIRSRTDRDV